MFTIWLEDEFAERCRAANKAANASRKLLTEAPASQTSAALGALGLARKAQMELALELIERIGTGETQQPGAGK